MPPLRPPLETAGRPVSTEVQRVGVERWRQALWSLTGGLRLRFQRTPPESTPGRIEGQIPVVAREERDISLPVQGWPERWPRGGEATARGGRVTRTAQLTTDVQVLSHDGVMAAVADRKETALKLARRKGLLRTGEAAA